MAETIDVDDMEVDKEVIVIDSDTEEELAEQKKEAGNALYKLKQYWQALPLYTEAISLQPSNASLYGNRAACYMMLGQFKEALDDARTSTSLDPGFVKGYIRMMKCFIAFGDLTAAQSTLTKLTELDPDNSAISSSKQDLAAIVKFNVDADTAYGKKDYRLVVYCMDRAIGLGVTSSVYKLRKAECLAFLGRFQEAQEIANDVLRVDKQNADAIYVRGVCLYYEDNVDRAFTHFQQALRLAPDHSKVLDIYKKAKSLKQKKEEGNSAFLNSNLEQAYQLYTEALDIDPNNNITNAKLYYNRATVSSKLGKLSSAVVDCTSALNLDEKYLKALQRRAKCYTDLSDYEEAVKDYEALYKLDKSHENRRLLTEAKLQLKKSKRKDYYKILGITKNANNDEIKKAYRKRALVHHPDRHANASDVEKLEQEKRFKEVGEAYGVLSDPKKRARYDNGQDLGDMEGMSDIDPNHIFQTFFSDAGPANFSFNAGGFPTNGFTFQFG